MVSEQRMGEVPMRCLYMPKLSANQQEFAESFITTSIGARFPMGKDRSSMGTNTSRISCCL